MQVYSTSKQYTGTNKNSFYDHQRDKLLTGEQMTKSDFFRNLKQIIWKYKPSHIHDCYRINYKQRILTHA